MINTNSLRYKMIEGLLYSIEKYFDKQNYSFTYKFVFKPEKKKLEKEEKSYKLKYFATKEGRREYINSIKKWRKKRKI